MTLIAPVVQDPLDRAPLLAQRFWLYKSPEEWKAYVEGLYDATSGKKGKKKAVPSQPVTVSRSKKGVISFRFKRDSKWITTGELEAFAKTLGLEPKELQRLVEKRKIEIRKDKT